MNLLFLCTMLLSTSGYVHCAARPTVPMPAAELTREQQKAVAIKTQQKKMLLKNACNILDRAFELLGNAAAPTPDQLASFIKNAVAGLDKEIAQLNMPTPGIPAPFVTLQERLELVKALHEHAPMVRLIGEYKKAEQNLLEKLAKENADSQQEAAALNELRARPEFAPLTRLSPAVLGTMTQFRWAPERAVARDYTELPDDTVIKIHNASNDKQALARLFGWAKYITTKKSEATTVYDSALNNDGSVVAIDKEDAFELYVRTKQGTYDQAYATPHGTQEEFFGMDARGLMLIVRAADGLYTYARAHQEQMPQEEAEVKGSQEEPAVVAEKPVTYTKTLLVAGSNWDDIRISKDGSTIFCALRNAQKVSVYFRGADGSYTLAYSTPAELNEQFYGDDETYDFYAQGNGSAFVVERIEGALCVYTRRADGKYVQGYTTPGLAGDEGDARIARVDYLNCLTEDGSVMIVSEEEDGGELFIYARNSDGMYKHIQIIMSDGYSAMSEDGSTLVYSDDNNGLIKAVMRDAAGTYTNAIEFPKGLEFSSINSSGSVIVLYSAHAPHIYERTIDFNYRLVGLQSSDHLIARGNIFLSADGTVFVVSKGTESFELFMRDYNDRYVRMYSLQQNFGMMSQDGSTFLTQSPKEGLIHCYSSVFAGVNFTPEQISLLYDLSRFLPLLHKDARAIRLNDSQSKVWLSLSPKIRNYIMRYQKKLIITVQAAATAKENKAAASADVQPPAKKRRRKDTE